jgi:hypothetical protein
VFNIAALHSILLTPRFSEVYGQPYDHNRFSGLPARRRKTAEAVEARSRVINTPLKQGVNESFNRRQQDTRNGATR